MWIMFDPNFHFIAAGSLVMQQQCSLLPANHIQMDRPGVEGPTSNGFRAACLDGWSGTPSRQPQPPRLRAEEGNNIIRPLNFGFSTSKLVLLWILLILLQNRERGEGQEKLNTFTGLCLSRKSKKPEGGGSTQALA